MLTEVPVPTLTRVASRHVRHRPVGATSHRAPVIILGECLIVRRQRDAGAIVNDQQTIHLQPVWWVTTTATRLEILSGSTRDICGSESNDNVQAGAK